MNFTILSPVVLTARWGFMEFPQVVCSASFQFFSQSTESGYGYSEETKPMLNTSNGFVPWDDLHHIALSTTNGEHDGKWAFGNGNNTPRIARVDLSTFRTSEILEIPNSAGNHSSPFITENTEYIVAGTRFSVPLDNDNGDVPLTNCLTNKERSIRLKKTPTLMLQKVRDRQKWNARVTRYTCT